MTETSPASFLGMRSDSLETRSSSVGYPLDHIEVRLDNDRIIMIDETNRSYIYRIFRSKSSIPSPKRLYQSIQRENFGPAVTIPCCTTGTIQLWRKKLLPKTDGFDQGLYKLIEHLARLSFIIIFPWITIRDLCQLNERGYAKIVGRMKDMIIRGGENIYPREIEEVLNTHPDVQDAQVSYSVKRFASIESPYIHWQVQFD